MPAVVGEGRDVHGSEKRLQPPLVRLALRADETLRVVMVHALGTQRALKVFGIFTRQDILYRNSKYLIHIPRLWRYTLANLQFEALGEIRAWLDKNVPQGFIENEITMNDNF